MALARPAQQHQCAAAEPPPLHLPPPPAHSPRDWGAQWGGRWRGDLGGGRRSRRGGEPRDWACRHRAAAAAACRPSPTPIHRLRDPRHSAMRPQLLDVNIFSQCLDCKLFAEYFSMVALMSYFLWVIQTAGGGSSSVVVVASWTSRRGGKDVVLPDLASQPVRLWYRRCRSRGHALPCHFCRRPCGSCRRLCRRLGLFTPRRVAPLGGPVARRGRRAAPPLPAAAETGRRRRPSPPPSHGRGNGTPTSP